MIVGIVGNAHAYYSHMQKCAPFKTLEKLRLYMKLFSLVYVWLMLFKLSLVVSSAARLITCLLAATWSASSVRGLGSRSLNPYLIDRYY